MSVFLVLAHRKLCRGNVLMQRHILGIKKLGLKISPMIGDLLLFVVSTNYVS